MDPHLRTPRADPFHGRQGRSPANAASEGFFGRPEQEFHYNRDHQDQNLDEFIDDLDGYLVWYRDERIKTQYGTSIRRQRLRELFVTRHVSTGRVQSMPSSCVNSRQR